jgi:pimeloyl-ACP methyl ester carboxylesterase
VTTPLFDPATIRRPGAHATLGEAFSWWFETAWLGTLWGWLLNAAPRGDGHAVMVLPGFATSDGMTLALRHFLGLLGYRVFPWNLGWNFDHHTVGANGEHIAREIQRIRDEVGGDVSLVGWSLGGVIAREAARRNPDGVRQVIALGSPFAGDPEATSLSLLYTLTTGTSARSPEARARSRRGVMPLPVPSSAIFSRSDGITAWQNCIGQTDAITENIEVRASHFGFMANPGVYFAVADRLAHTKGEWQPFEPQGTFAASFYPER